MSMIFGVLYSVLAMYSVAAGIYMLLLVVGAWLYRSPRSTVAPDQPKFAVIIHAHNEERDITATLEAVMSADYPALSLRVFVVADNCEDATADVARSVGATVWVRTDPAQRGKGQALDWAIRQHAQILSDFDLVAFIDADMHTDRNFFRAAARWFAAGKAAVLQGRYTMSGEDLSWNRAMVFASFAYVNHVRPAGRCWWGGSAGLKGGGMVFRRELVVQMGWPAKSIIEDVELGIQLALDGVRVVYAPDAVVTSSVPKALRDSRVQQARWEGGKKAIVTGMLVPLLRRCVTRPTLLSVDALLDMLVLPLSILVCVCLVSVPIAVAAGQSVLPFLSVLVVFGAAVVTGLVQLRAPAGVWLRLMLAPIFVLWKVLVIASVILSRRLQSWQRTPRETK